MINATIYEDTHQTEKEMSQANEALDKFQMVVEETIGSIRSGRQLDLEQIDNALGAVLDSMARNPNAMIWLARLGKTDDYTFRHSINTSIWAVSLGRQIGLPPADLRLLGQGAVFCDIGKAEMPQELLLRNGPLSDMETAVIHQHLDFSLEIAKKVGDLDPAILTMIAQHHECHDGSGYPDGLKHDEIDLYGRIAGIADCFDAMINTRPYCKGVPISAAIREMYNLRGSRFQQELMEEFIHAIGLYPAGTLVELTSGQVGVVIGESRVRRLRPRVMLLLNHEKVAMDHFPVLDLIHEQVDMDGKALNILRDLQPDAYGLDPGQYFLA